MRSRVAVAILGVVACSRSGTVVSTPPPAPSPLPAKEIAIEPSYQLVHTAGLIESADGVERFVQGGARIERGPGRGLTVNEDVRVNDGAAFPSWTASGEAGFRYLFWAGAQLFGAANFTGELTLLRTFPAQVREVEPWLDGLAVTVGGGVRKVTPAGDIGVLTAVPGVGFALAVDADRAVVQSLLGLTYVRESAAGPFRRFEELGDVRRGYVRRDDLVLVGADGGQLRLDARGQWHDQPYPEGSTPDELTDRYEDWPTDESTIVELLSRDRAAARLPDGTAFVVGDRHYGRVDLESERVLGLGELPESVEECAPHVAETPLLLCRDRQRAYVYQAAEELILERTFVFRSDYAQDAFVADSQGALAFVGPCVADLLEETDDDVDSVSGATPYNASYQGRPQICVRTRSTWTEHRVEGADARDVRAWVAGSNGSATAIVVQPEAMMTPAEPSQRRGGLRVVRVAASSPPLDLPPYPSRQPLVVSRELWLEGDGSVRGWFAQQNSESVPVLIDDAGRVQTAWMPREIRSLAHAGERAVAMDAWGQLFETQDGAASWKAVPPPPLREVTVRDCSVFGCDFGHVARIGWSARGERNAGASDVERPNPVEKIVVDDTRISLDAGRQLPPAILRLSCTTSSAPDVRRIPDSHGFGVTPGSKQRSYSLRPLAGLGTLDVPRGTGDVTAGWVDLFDLEGATHRRTMSVADVGGDRAVPYRVQTAPWLDARGHVMPLAVGHGSRCGDELLRTMGIAEAPIGCVAPPVSGVQLRPGTSAFLFAAGRHHFEVRSARIASFEVGGASPVEGGAGIQTTPELLTRHWVAGGQERLVGAGTIGAKPGVVVSDQLGIALGASFDPASGKLSEPMVLAPLANAALGSSAACRGKRSGELDVVMSLDGALASVIDSDAEVYGSAERAIARLRWSADRVCLDAVDMEVRDARFDAHPSAYGSHGWMKKLVVVFQSSNKGRLIEIGPGTEIRQSVVCTSVEPGDGAG